MWQAKVWTTAGAESDWSAPASFETALAGAESWQGEWIGGADPDLELDRWRDYTVSVDFTMDNLVLGLYARATDLNNAYMLQLSVADGTPRYRPHVKTNGGYRLLESKDISSSISASELATGSHVFAVTFSGSEIVTSLDGTEIDRRTDTSHSRGFIGFRQSPATEGPEQATVHSVSVVASDGDTLLDADFAPDSADRSNPFTAGTVTDAGLQLHSPIEAIYRSVVSEPILRKDFAVGDEHGAVTSARLYAAARGVYEVSINGQKVGDEHLAPGWTDYASRIDSQSYDVTALLQGGENTVGAMLADGWYAGHLASFGTGHYGTEPSFIGQLRIDYADGSSEVVATDDSWRTTAGPFVAADLIMGEDFDARLQRSGWTSPGFDDSAWQPAGIVADDGATALLEPQSDEPVRTIEERTPISRTDSAPGTWIYDLGQNMVGVARMDLTGTADSTATIRYGEMLNPDGTLYTANLRSAKATDTYTFAETGTASYTPTFTFHGFRYLEVTGVSEPPSIEQITGLVWGSDLATTGSLETSSAMLNQLQSNITWGQRGNFLSIPTDTPARDERLGWTGDINVFAPTASYNQDTLTFLSKWLVDLEDSQGANGDLPGVSPSVGGCCGGGTGWSDAGITVPFTLWQSYGDTDVITKSYPMMKRFLDYVESSTGPSLIRSSGGYADWLNLDDPTDGGLLGTAYYAFVTDMMAQMAAAIGEEGDAAHYAKLSKDVAAAFAAKYLAADGTVQGNSQTGYAIAIGMGLVPDEQLAAVGAKYVAKIASRDNHLSTGFLGTPWLLPALTAIGQQDLAYRLLNNDTFPSWGYEVAQGATTMWERWDSLKPDGSFGDVTMNSFNHYAYGAVGDWMYRNIGGINATSAGYKTFDIAPSIGGGLTSGRGSFESVYGTIVSDWSVSGATTSLAVSVPASSTATVSIPAVNRWAVTEGGVPLAEAAGVEFVSEADGVVTVRVGSGDYAFSSDPADSGIVVEGLGADPGEQLPGGTATGIVRVTNTGTAPITGFSAAVSTSTGLAVEPASVTVGKVAAGAVVDLPFSVDVPVTTAPGAVTVTADVTATVGEQAQAFSLTTPFVTVLPAVAFTATAITAGEAAEGELPEVATVTASLTNAAAVPITGRLVVDAPEDWPAPLPSEQVVLPAGGSADARVTAAIPLSLDAGSSGFTVRFVAEEQTLASATTSLDLALTTPPANPTDHVDLGDGPSEQAHAVGSSGNGGTSSEAGLTRRYSGLTTVGSWFEFDLAVTPGEPFLLRAIETYDRAQTKSYDILVNGELVAQRLHQRTDGGAGTQTYQLLVPDDGTLTGSGTVTVRFQFNGLGSHDPSVADVWSLPVPVDTVAPSVQLDISHAGEQGWYLEGAAVDVQASDARSAVESIEFATGDGEWSAYDEPIVLDEGATTLRVRATDTAGNVSAVRTETIRVDATAPSVWGWLSSSGRVFSFAQDAAADSTVETSTVDRLEYSADGSTWHRGLSALLAAVRADDLVQLQVRSVDVAGNRSATLELAGTKGPDTLPVRRGWQALVEASGFAPGAVVRVELHSDPVLLGTATADALGTVQVRGVVPADLAEGEHSLVFAVVEDPGTGPGEPGTGGPGGGGVTIPVDVLSSTGANVLPWIVGGGAALLLGLALLLTTRRRRTAASATPADHQPTT